MGLDQSAKDKVRKSESIERQTHMSGFNGKINTESHRWKETPTVKHQCQGTQHSDTEQHIAQDSQQHLVLCNLDAGLL